MAKAGDHGSGSTQVGESSFDEPFFRCTIDWLLKKGKNMETQITHEITCPNCHKTISNHPIIDAAVTGAGNGSQNIICDCGERITFWAITAQLREQKTFGRRFKTWFRSLSPSRG
jgi:hypothetical protein